MSDDYCSSNSITAPFQIDEGSSQLSRGRKTGGRPGRSLPEQLALQLRGFGRYFARLYFKPKSRRRCVWCNLDLPSWPYYGPSVQPCAACAKKYLWFNPDQIERGGFK